MYYISKISWFFLQPSSFLVFLTLLGVALLWRGRAKWGRRLVTIGGLGLVIAGLSPLGHWLVLPLEERFALPALSGSGVGKSKPAGIIVLGGAQDTRVSGARGVAALNEAGERMTEAVALARHFPDLPIVFSGGSATILYASISEAKVARGFFQGLGLAPSRITLEPNSRTTYENARFTKRLLEKLGEKKGRPWLLVTSAFHMPRAVGCFRKAGIKVLPWPVDYRTRGRADLWRFFSRPSEGLRRVDFAVKEWIGLVAYYALGRTSALLPGDE